MSDTSRDARNQGANPRASYDPAREEALVREIRDDVEHLHGPGEVRRGPDEVALVSLVRDGEPWVRPFLDYHLSLGVKHVTLLDNGSGDRTVDIAKEYDNVTVLRTTLPFKSHKHAARRYLIHRSGNCNWVLYLDIDEMFDYPHSDVVGLDALIEYLSRKSYTALATQTLDMFPEKPLLSAAEDADRPLEEAHRFYDLSGLQREEYGRSDRADNLISNPEIKVLRGGIQKSIFGHTATLTKHSLAFVDESTSPMNVSVHWPEGARVADFTGVVLRYRFTSDIRDRAIRLSREEGHGENSAKYRQYLDVLEETPNLQIKRKTSEELQGVNNLVDKGFLIVSESYMKWVDRKEEKNPTPETLVAKPYRLAEAFCEAKARREATSRRVSKLKRLVEELESAVSEEQQKSSAAEQKSQRLQAQLRDVQHSRIWRVLTRLASARDELSGVHAPPARRLINAMRRARGRGYVGDYTSEHSEPAAKDDTSEQEANKTKSSEHGEAERVTSGSRNDRQRRVRLHKRRIAQLKERLYALGFTERAFEDLQNLAKSDSKPVLQRLAAWELSLWHANQHSEEGARLCLYLLPVALQGENDPVRLRQAAVIEAECQELLGNVEAARGTVSRALESEPHADLFLARASLEASTPARMEWLNKALQLHGISEITCDPSAGNSLLDSLRLAQEPTRAKASSEAKVSVIIPVYNAENVIQTALDSVLSQTWNNLEVLVVDDCSTDDTVPVVEDYARRDPRVHLLKTETNGGPYVARNLALSVATGEFVTCHDADDWSHPEKIEKQARLLLGNPSVIGNTSQHARVTDELRFYRRGNPGYYVASNFSSLMFRCGPVMEVIGYWDHVRFGADTEFKKRITKVFGDNSVVDVPTGPLSFIRQSTSSLTGDEAFGLYRALKGARKEYLESFTHFHETAENLRLDFFQEERAFAAPEPMWPDREVKGGERRHFDVILVSDFRVPEDFNVSNVEQIEAQKQMGLRTGLVQISQYDTNPARTLEQSVREQLDGDRVQMLVYGEKVSCDTLIVRHPPILQEWQKFVPDVEASNIHVVVDQTPRSNYDEEGKLAYSISRCEEHVQRYFGKPGLWHPTGSSIRKALRQHHEQELKQISLADEDWSNATTHKGSKSMAQASDNCKNVQKQGYWSGRTELMYYQYVDFLVRALAADAKSLIDVGSADAQYIERFNWIQKRHTLDITKPYNSENVAGIEMDFFDFEPEEKYDFVTCLQVLEHIPDVEAFARKLFHTAHRVLISVPYLWEEGSTSSHVHDPVDLDKLFGWTGRKPDYYIVVQEPLSKRQRLISYYHAGDEKVNFKEARRNAESLLANTHARGAG